MERRSRVSLARKLRPGLPTAAIERIGRRTGTFADVFSVVSSERLAEVSAWELPLTVKSPIIPRLFVFAVA